MMYSNYPYGLFNPVYLEQYQAQMEQNRKWEQNKNIADMVKALPDFLNVSEKLMQIISSRLLRRVCLQSVCIWQIKTEGIVNDNTRNCIKTLESL